MDPQQALKILDNAAGLAALPRSDHVAVQQAVAVLTAVVAQPPAPVATPGAIDPAIPPAARKKTSPRSDAEGHPVVATANGKPL